MSYGGRYDFSHRKIHEAPPVPEFLLAARERVAQWADLVPERLVFAVISEYTPGAPIGWHRDAPEYGQTVGISLQGRARLRFRPYRRAATPGVKRSRVDIVSVELDPRSAYVIRGDARWRWQHSIPPVTETRYSITFRTARNHED